jgi:hypothetical protein
LHLTPQFIHDLTQHDRLSGFKRKVKVQLKFKVIAFVTALVLGLTVAGTAQAQQTYSGAKVEYAVEFASPTWRLMSEPDETHQHAEWIYGDRLDGHLRIRKEAIEADVTVKEFARRDQELKVRFLPGYVDGKEERFEGRLPGVTIGYEFTTAGKPMAGRTYYLQADARTVYVLRFTGLRDKLARIRNQTDAIARSFRLK